MNESINPEPPIAGDEAATLLWFLERQRASFAWKTHGLDEAGLRATHAPSALTRFTIPWNAPGQPVISVPGGFDDQGLPIGLPSPVDRTTNWRYARWLTSTSRRPAGNYAYRRSDPSGSHECDLRRSIVQASP